MICKSCITTLHSKIQQFNKIPKPATWELPTSPWYCESSRWPLKACPGLPEYIIVWTIGTSFFLFSATLDLQFVSTKMSIGRELPEKLSIKLANTAVE